MLLSTVFASSLVETLAFFLVAVAEDFFARPSFFGLVFLLFGEVFGLTLAGLVAVVFFLALVALFLGAPVDFAVPTAFFAFGVGVARVFRVLA